MGILSRFKDIMASNVHAIFNKEDKHPERTVEKYLTQMRSDLGQIKSETAAYESEARRAKMALDENTSDIAKWERYIAKANENGNLSDAAVYENKLATAKSEHDRLEANYNQAKQNLDSLAELNDKLSSDVATLEAKMTEVKSKMDAAKAQEEMNKAAAKTGMSLDQDTINRMNQKADYMMDKANAKAELDRFAADRSANISELDELASKYDSDKAEDATEILTSEMIDIKSDDSDDK